MLNLLFLICAAAGGTLLFLQLGLMLLGMGDDVDGGLDGDAGLDVDADVDLDGDHSTAITEAADADFDHPDASWLFQVVSVKGVVAAITFFGLGGLWANSMDMGPGPALGLGGIMGAAALYGIYWLMKQLYKLRSSGTVNINNARGCAAKVYVPIPAAGNGRGKIHVTIQGRTMEYEAVTEEPERLATGENVVVAAVLDSDLVSVARATTASHGAA